MADPGWKPLVAIERGIDTDPLRQQLWDCQGQPVTPALQARLRRLAESIDVRAQSPPTLVMLARLLVSVRLVDSAIQILQDGQYAYPGDFWLNFELGNQLAHKVNPDAIRYLSVAVGIRPDAVTPNYVLGFTLFRQGKKNDAAACFRKVLDLDPTVMSAHYFLGTILRESKKLDEATGHFRRCIELAPNIASGHYGLGAVLCDKQRWEDAVVSLQEAVKFDPNWPGPRLMLGFALFRQDKVDESMTCFQEAIKLDRNYSDAHGWLANALERKGLIKEAIAAWRQAIRIKPSAARFRTVATLYAAIGQWDKAIVDCDRAIKADPENPQSWYLAAVCDAETGNVEGYLRVCREMLKRFSDTNQAVAAERTVSACLLLPHEINSADMGRLQKLAERAVTGTEKDAGYCYAAAAKGLAAYRSGRHKEAAVWLERYSRNTADAHSDATAFAVLAMAQHRDGRTVEARSTLSQAQAILAKNRPDPKKGRLYTTPECQRWLYSQILCRQAETLLGKKEVK
jgi:tetratricopeptide (TPR) repeat protein